MPSLTFPHPITGRDHTIKFSQVAYGGDVWQVYLDDCDKGTLRPREEWIFGPSRTYRVYGDDINVPIDIIGGLTSSTRLPAQ